MNCSKKGLVKTIITIIPTTCISFGLAAQDKPNFVWIMSEDNSKHFIQLFDSNGTNTPNINALAQEGVVFTRSFSNAPVCSAARTTLLTGCYGSRIGAHYHRKHKKVPMPDGLIPFPQYLKEAGYYTTNNSKTDYNVDVNNSNIWNASSKKATWRNRSANQPFFHVQTYGDSHEGQLHNIGTSGNTNTNQDSVFIPPVHPNTSLFRYTYAKYHDKMITIDNKVGNLVNQLKNDSLLENTFIFYFGDHGGVLPGSKGYIYETGLHVPLVIRIPEKFRDSVNVKAGTKVDGFVSFIDFGPTLLRLAGIEIPDQMDGIPFLGKDISNEELDSRDSTYSYADRFDEKYDLTRAIREGKYKYIRNYQPFNFDGLYNMYRYKMAAYKEWRNKYKNGELDSIQSLFFMEKEPEALYNIDNDPYETTNLAHFTEYDSLLKKMRAKLTNKVKSLPDLSMYPESYLIDSAFNNPVVFGQKNKNEIAQLVDVANLMLHPFDSIKSILDTVIHSSNPWKRYWGLIVCSRFKQSALQFADTIKYISENDPELLVRVRAAEFLGLTGYSNPKYVLVKALEESKKPMEALLILNTIVLLMDGNPGYCFDIYKSRLNSNVTANSWVKTRLNYIASKNSKACGCIDGDPDMDKDGVCDIIDECILDSSKTEPGLCGCGEIESDTCLMIKYTSLALSNPSFELPKDGLADTRISDVTGWKDDNQVTGGNGRYVMGDGNPAFGKHVAYIGKDCGIMYQATGHTITPNTIYVLKFYAKSHDTTAGEHKLHYALSAYMNPKERANFIEKESIFSSSTTDWKEYELRDTLEYPTHVIGKKLSIDFDISTNGNAKVDIDNVRAFKYIFGDPTISSSQEVYNHSKIAIHPTLVKNIINIEGFSNEFNLQLIDISGRMVFSKSYDLGVVDLTELKSGLYILNVYNETRTKKVLIVKKK